MTTNKQKVYQILRKVKAFFHDRNLGTFCLFLLFATILWFGHSLNSVRERTLDIPIEYAGVSEDVVLSEPLPQSIQIVVRDQGKRLRTYRQTSFSPIQFDLSSQLSGESGQVTIYSEQIRQRVTDQLQGTAKLQRILPETIVRGFQRQKHKRVKVVFTGQVLPTTQYLLASEPVVEPTMVTIYAPKEVLDTIRCVYTENRVFKDVKDSLNAQVPLIVPQRARSGNPYVGLHAFAEQYTEKVFSLPIVPQEVPQGLHLRTFPAIAEVVVKVGISHFNDIQEQDLKVQCLFPQDKGSLLSVQVVTKNPYILGYRISPQEVEYIIEH